MLMSCDTTTSHCESENVPGLLMDSCQIKLRSGFRAVSYDESEAMCFLDRKLKIYNFNLENPYFFLI